MKQHKAGIFKGVSEAVYPDDLLSDQDGGCYKLYALEGKDWAFDYCDYVPELPPRLDEHTLGLLVNNFACQLSPAFAEGEADWNKNNGNQNPDIKREI